MSSQHFFLWEKYCRSSNKLTVLTCFAFLPSTTQHTHIRTILKAIWRIRSDRSKISLKSTLSLILLLHRSVCVFVTQTMWRMTLLYLLTFVGFLVQICFITLAIGKWNALRDIPTHPINLIISSGWSLLFSRIGRRVYCSCQESDISFDLSNDDNLRLVHIFR